MFTPFSRPLARALPLGFVIIAVLTAAGRFLILDGDAWNWGAAGATLAVCAVGASHWSALRQLDVSPLAWFRSALATLAVWSVALSAVITAAANLMQANSPTTVYTTGSSPPAATTTMWTLTASPTCWRVSASPPDPSPRLF